MVKKLKCWRKEYSGKKLIRFKKKDGTELEIYTERINGKNTPFVAVTDSKRIRDKEFKTKPKATKFAEDYMSKNDRC